MKYVKGSFQVLIYNLLYDLETFDIFANVPNIFNWLHFVFIYNISFISVITIIFSFLYKYRITVHIYINYCNLNII